MASFARLALPQCVWTIEEHALFAARKEFELLKLLSTDKKALATARRLGFTTSAWQPHSHTAVASSAAAPAALSTAGANDSSTPSHAKTAPRRTASRARRFQHQPQPHPLKVAAATAATSRCDEPAAVMADGPSATSRTARQRRSAARSARHHARQQQAAARQAHTRMLAILFITRIRRRARLHRDLKDLEELELAPALAVKRGPESEPRSSSASSSCDPHDFDHHHVMGVVKTSTRVSHLAKRFSGWGQRAITRCNRLPLSGMHGDPSRDTLPAAASTPFPAPCTHPSRVPRGPWTLACWG